MKYYLVKYKNGLFAYKDSARYCGYIERIKTFEPSDASFFNMYVGTVRYFTELGLILFMSEDLDEIMERAALEAL